MNIGLSKNNSPNTTPMKPVSRFSWALIVGLLGYLFFILNPESHFMDDPDSLLHISAGNWIFNHLSVPLVDPFSFNTAGKEWIDHEWLSQLILAFAYYLGGFAGLKILTGAFFGLTLGLQLRFMIQRVPPIYALLFSAFCFVSLQNHLLARPHIITWPIIIYWFSCLLQACEEKKVPPYWLSLLMIIWANLHGSFLLGLLAIPFCALEAVITTDHKMAVAKSWMKFLLLCSIACLITPFGWKSYSFGVDLMSSAYITRIIEWAPATGFSLLSMEIWLGLLLTLGLLGRVRFSFGRLLLLLGVLHEALAHVRYISIFGLLAPLLLAAPFGIAYQSKLNGTNPIDQFFNRLSSPCRSITLLLSSSFFLMFGIWFTSLSVIQLDPVIAPKEALEAIKASGIKGRVLNGYIFGGYLIFNQIPVFIDGRADLHGNPGNNDFYTFTDSADIEKIRELLDQHQIAWTIFQPTEKTVMYLNTQKDWKKIYEDSNSVVHVRVSQ